MMLQTKSIITERNTVFLKNISETPQYIQWHSAFIVCSIMENSIGLKRVNVIILIGPGHEILVLTVNSEIFVRVL